MRAPLRSPMLSIHCNDNAVVILIWSFHRLVSRVRSVAEFILRDINDFSKISNFVDLNWILSRNIDKGYFIALVISDEI